MGAQAYRIFEQHSDVADDECVVEVGSERGEGSTSWFSQFCGERGIAFYTVDIDPEVHEGAKALIGACSSCSAHLISGEEFLGTIEKKIRFAYLDGFDCIPKGLEKEEFIDYYRKKYKAMGLSMTNGQSAKSHLKQAQLIDQRAASRCAVLIDDTYLEGSRWVGKGSRAMPYLRRRGFKVSDLGGAGLATRCA